MNIKELTRLHSIASDTRRVIEDDLSDQFPADMEGACAIASAILFDRLFLAGLNPRVGYTIYHCWVEVDCTIVDLTATQFGSKYKRVEIFSKLGAPDKWRSTLEFGTMAEFVNELRSDNWPEYQIPNEKYLAIYNGLTL